MVYIELVYILNFLLDFMILYGTKRLLKINKNILRILLGSFIGSITTIQVYVKLNSIELIIIKTFLSLIMNYAAFGKKNLLKNTFYFYVLSIIYGGFIYLLDIDLTFYHNMILLIILCPLTIYIFIKEYNNYKINIKDKYNVTIVYLNKTYNLEGFIDTGNHLKDPITNKNVILVDLDIKTNKVIYIPYKALNTEGIIPCIKPDKVLINNKEINKCLIGLSKDKISIPGISCILPNQIKENL